MIVPRVRMQLYKGKKLGWPCRRDKRRAWAELCYDAMEIGSYIDSEYSCLVNKLACGHCEVDIDESHRQVHQHLHGLAEGSACSASPSSSSPAAGASTASACTAGCASTG